MFSLAILLFVHGRQTFLAAGLAVGAFTLAGAVVGPLLGALVDRGGQTRVLLAAAGAQATLLVALVLAAWAGAAMAAIVALAALAGAAQPPIAGCIRALWSDVAGDGEALQTAYALDATTQEVIWTPGPCWWAPRPCSSRRPPRCWRARRSPSAEPPSSRPPSCPAVGGGRARALAARCPGQSRAARAARHGGARGRGDRSGRGRAACAGPAARLALVRRPAPGPVQHRQHGRRAAVLSRELAAPDRAALHRAAARHGDRRGAADRRALPGRRIPAERARRARCRADALLSVLARGSARQSGHGDGGVHLAQGRDDRRHGSRIDPGRIAGRRPRRGRRFALGCASVALACVLAMLWRQRIDPVRVPGERERAGGDERDPATLSTR